MNRKVNVISQSPVGIIPSDKDPDIYNVYSFTTEHRIVDMLIFECTCPSKHKSFCSHLRAVLRKFKTRYNSEVADIYSILNDVNVKNSLASCIDKADNHFKLFSKSINNHFQLNEFGTIDDFSSKKSRKKYMKILNATLKSLSSISWRFYLIKTKDNSFINSIYYAKNARNAIEVDVLLEALNFSLSTIKKDDYSTVSEFLQAIESNSLENIGVFNPTSIINILTSMLCKTIISNENKEVLVDSIVEFFRSNKISLHINRGTESKFDGRNSLFLHVIFKTIKRYFNYIDTRLIKESINLILMEEFGLNLNLLGIDVETITHEISLVKNNLKENTGVLDLLSFKMGRIDLLTPNSISSDKFDSFPDNNLFDIIYSAPVLVDLYDYLFWYSSGNQTKHGDLTEFLENNIDKKVFSHFFFIKFSKNANKYISLNSRLVNNQICIYKIVKPNNETYSATHIYYSLMVDSITKCDGIQTLNYFIGGCIQENGIYEFIKIFPKEILIRDISSLSYNSFNLPHFFLCISKACPPIIYVDLWDYVLTSILFVFEIEKEQLVISLSEYFMKSDSIFELNKLFHIIPVQTTRDFYTKIYNCLNLNSSSIENEVPHQESKEKYNIPDKLHSDNESSFEELGCEYCLDKPNIMDCKNFIISIQEQKFGISDKTRDADYSLIIQNYNRIINQSCRNLSIKLYTKINHFIFELMQNADDNLYCSCIGRIPSVVFVFHKAGVLVINNEIGFTEKDVSSICDIGNSSKISDEKTIGCFGIGFKSVFSITNTPYIFSNGYNFMFNLDSKHGSYIFPEWVNDNIVNLIPFHKYHSEYNTEISTYKTKFWFPYKDKINFDIKINDNIILFTNKIKKIKLITNSKVLQIKRNDIFLSSDIMLSNITREILHDDFSSKKQKISLSKVSTKSYLIVNYQFQIPKNISNLVKSKRSNKMSIGIEINNSELDSYDGECNSENKEVFSFLPIKPYGLKFIIQADFDLTSSRESISVDSSWNIYLREIIPNAIIHMISKLREINGFHLLKKSVIDIIPTKMDIIDEFFLPVVSRINQALTYEKCIFTFEKTFTQPSNSVYINRNSKTYELLLHIFPNINEFSYLLYKYSNKYLIYNIYINSRNILFEDLGLSEFNIDMLIEMLIGITSDYSYFDRSYEWYFNLFLLIDVLINTSNDINSVLQKLQAIPLFLTEEGLYKGSINPVSIKNQLYCTEEDFPSISKLGIHFINKNFILQLKEFYKEQNFNYNRIINLIQTLGIITLKSEYYYEIIEESLTTTTLSVDDHIYFTYLLAKSNYSSHDKQIFAISSNNEFLPLTASYFHLLHSNEKYSIVDTVNKIIDNKSQDLMKNLSYNEFNNKYLLYGDESFWNSFFRKFGVTVLPFYFEQIKFDRLSDYVDYLKSNSKFNNDKLIEKHIESMNTIADYSIHTSITDFYCHGIDTLAILMSEALSQNGNTYFEELVTMISNQIISCVCDFWVDIKKYWTAKINEAINIPSFVKTQFSTYPIFISRYLSKGQFIFNRLCPPKLLTLFIETHQHQVISRFVNFLVLDIQKEAISTTLLEAFSSIIEIDLNYLCLLVEALYNSSKEDVISLYSRQMDQNSCINLLEIIIKESKENYSADSGNVLKKNLLIPIQDDDKYYWKHIEELFWSDGNILPNSHSLLYQFSKKYKLNISIDDIMRFFILLGVPVKPGNKHLIAYLLDLYKAERIELDSRLLFTYINIISQVHKTDARALNDIIQFPVIKKNYCKWLKLDSIINCDSLMIFSESILFHYFIHKNIFPKKKIIWTPLYFLFSQSNTFVDNIDINSLANDWNTICSQLLADKLEDLNHFDILPINSSLNSTFYYEVIVNFFGPLYEESIKDKIKTRKNWSKLILKSDIILLNSNISINCKGKVINLPSIFDNTANKLYVKNQNQLKNDEVEQVILSIFTYISSFFPGYYPNSKSLRAAIIVFNDVVKEFESNKNKVNWDKLILNWIQKLESEQFNFKIDLKYFLLTDYVGDYFQSSNDIQIVEEIQLDYYVGNNCPKKIILEIGKRGEELAYNYMKTMFNTEINLGLSKVTWLNEIEESGLPYDILLVLFNKKNGTEEEIFIEVKSSSKKERNCFYITFNEWKYAEKLQGNYWIFHILGVNSNASNIDPNDIEYRIIKNPYESWRSGNLKMILSRN